MVHIINRQLTWYYLDFLSRTFSTGSPLGWQRGFFSLCTFCWIMTRIRGIDPDVVVPSGSKIGVLVDKGTQVTVRVIDLVTWTTLVSFWFDVVSRDVWPTSTEPKCFILNCVIPCTYTLLVGFKVDMGSDRAPLCVASSLTQISLPHELYLWITWWKSGYLAIANKN